MKDGQNYFSSERIGETLLPSFKATMTSPTPCFENMPVAQDYKNSMVLLVIYLVIPALVVSIFSGLITIVFILPMFLLFGIAGTWSWAWYLGWAARTFCKSSLTTADAFQICAYGAAPVIFSMIPVVGVITTLWGLYLNWQGLVSHARIGGGSALLIILASFVVLGISLLLLVILLFYLAAQTGINLPEVQWF